MNWQLRGTLILLVCFGSARPAIAQYAAEVVSYDQGTTAAEVFGSNPVEFFNDLSAPLGAPERITGEGVFPGTVTPYFPPFLPNEIISVGENGQLTLRLSNFVLPLSGSPEIGIFTNVGIVGIPDSPVASTVGAFGVDRAEVSVSADGDSWVSLGSPLFDIPTNGYSDIAETLESDFQQPFSEPLSSFAGLLLDDPIAPDIFDLLNGSGGGKWLDISDTGLAQVGFVRFSVADDGDASTNLSFELDAVSIARSASGGATVPEPNSLALGCLGIVLLLNNRVKSLNYV